MSHSLDWMKAVNEGGELRKEVIRIHNAVSFAIYPLFKIKHGTTVSYLVVDWIDAGPSRAGGRVFGEGSSCSDRSQSFGQEGHRSGSFVQVVFGFYGSEPNPFLLESSGVA